MSDLVAAEAQGDPGPPDEALDQDEEASSRPALPRAASLPSASGAAPELSEKERLLASETGGESAGSGSSFCKVFLISTSVVLLALAAFMGFKLQTQQAPTRVLTSFKKIYVVARDFNQSRHPGGHGDFQGSTTPADATVATELVIENQLDAEGKPVFKHPIRPGFTSKSNFDQWFRTVEGVNQKVPLCMEMKIDSESGSMTFDSQDFFPVDSLGFNDVRMSDTGAVHNYYFTIELNKKFMYHGGESISVRTDDDLWVFINGALVLDIGGLHRPLSKSAALDGLNLQVGSNATLQVFAAKRRCCGSNFRLETNIQFYSDACEQDTGCCLSDSHNLLCVDKPKWWTFWCPPTPEPVGETVHSSPDQAVLEE